MRTRRPLIALFACLVLAPGAAHAVPSGPEGADPGLPGKRTSLARVLIRLDTRFRPEGRLDRQDRRLQRKKITKERDRLLEDLAGTRSLSVRSYQTVPFVALALTEKGLQAARQSPHARGIREDLAVPPTLAES